MAKAPKKPATKPATKSVKKTTAKAAKKPTVKPAKMTGAKSAKKPAKKAAPKKVLKATQPSAKKSTPVQAAKATPKMPPKANSGKAKTSTLALESVFMPLDDRLLVVKNGVSDRTPGGLYIPDSVSTGDRPSEGKVVAVGRGHRDKKGRLRPLDVQLGDTVMFTAFSGSEVKIADQELLVLREQDIIAVVKA